MAQTPEKPAAPATPAAPTPAAEAPCVSAKSQLKAVKSERAELNVATKAKEEDPSPTRLDALRDEGAKVIADVRAKAVEVPPCQSEGDFEPREAKTSAQKPCPSIGSG